MGVSFEGKPRAMRKARSEDPGTPVRDQRQRIATPDVASPIPPASSMTTQNSQGQTQERAQAAHTPPAQVRVKVKHKNSPAPMLLSLGGIGLAGLGIAMVTLQGPLGEITSKLVKNGVQPGMLFLSGAMLGGLAIVSRQNNRAQQAINNRGGSVQDLSSTISSVQLGLDELRAHSTPLAAEVHALRSELHNFTSKKEEKMDQAGIFQVAGSVDKLAARVDQNMKTFGQEMEERLAAISARFDQSSVDVRDRVESLRDQRSEMEPALETLQARCVQIEECLAGMQPWGEHLASQSEGLQRLQSVLEAQADRSQKTQQGLEDAVQQATQEALQATLPSLIEKAIERSLATSVRTEVPNAVQTSVQDAVQKTLEASLPTAVASAVASSVADSLSAEFPSAAWELVRASVETCVRESVSQAQPAQDPARPTQGTEEAVEAHSNTEQAPATSVVTDLHEPEEPAQHQEVASNPAEETRSDLDKPASAQGTALFAWMKPSQPASEPSTEEREEITNADTPSNTMGDSPAQIERLFEESGETAMESETPEPSPTQSEVDTAFSQAFGEESDEPQPERWNLAEPETMLPDQPVSQQFPLEYVAPGSSRPETSQQDKEQPEDFARALDHLYQLDEPISEEGIQPTTSNPTQERASTDAPQHQHGPKQQEPVMDFQRDPMPPKPAPRFQGSEPAGIPGVPESPFPAPIPLNQDGPQEDFESDPNQQLEEPPAALPYEAPKNPLRFRFPEPDKD